MSERGKKYRKRIYLLAMALVGIAAVTGISRQMKMVRSYEPDNDSYGNAMMGYAPSATKRNLPDDVQLVYIDITWRELESIKGQFDFAAIEKENQIDRWRSEGKHAILRFVCDLPSDEKHMDIPEWLYKEMDGDGTWYDISYGRGFAPNYANTVFIENHARAVAALGEQYGDDTFISYVELGSLGHWGEWHVNYSTGIQRLPEESIREQYIIPWISAFPQAQIMMRRPFNAAARYGFGLFNDMFGHVESTQEWLDWIAEGGDFSQTNEENALSAMLDYWKMAPSGGEMTSSLSMEQMLSAEIETTIELAEKSHTTFLGPKIADANYMLGYQELLRHMGYRLHISEASLQRRVGATELTVTFENLGVAPMYWDWPVYALVLNGQAEEVERVELDVRLSELLPGGRITVHARLAASGLMETDHGGYQIGVGIVDPMTGEFAVRIDTQLERVGKIAVLFE